MMCAQVNFVTSYGYISEDNVMLLQHEEYQPSFDQAILHGEAAPTPAWWSANTAPKPAWVILI